MKQRPPAQPLDPEREAEELEEEAEEEPDELEEEAEEEPPTPPRQPFPPAMQTAAKPSFTAPSGPGINQHLLNLVVKRLEMQAELIQQMMDRQEAHFRESQADRESLRSLTKDLSTLSEMMQETIGTVDQHAERLTDATASLIRLHQERSQQV